MADFGFPGPVDDSILGVAAVATAIVVIWRQVLKPVVTAARQAATINDTLVEIAKEFRPDHGSSLKDVLTNIEGAVQQTGSGFTDFVSEHAVIHEQLGEQLDGLRDGQASLAEKIEEVHEEVTSGSPATIAALADAVEGRRISANIPKDRRTESEQQYVDVLDLEDGDDLAV